MKQREVHDRGFLKDRVSQTVVPERNWQRNKPSSPVPDHCIHKQVLGVVFTLQLAFKLNQINQDLTPCSPLLNAFIKGDTKSPVDLSLAGLNTLISSRSFLENGYRIPSSIPTAPAGCSLLRPESSLL